MWVPKPSGSEYVDKKDIEYGMCVVKAYVDMMQASNSAENGGDSSESSAKLIESSIINNLLYSIKGSSSAHRDTLDSGCLMKGQIL